MELWPLKDDLLEEEPAAVTHVYQYGDLLEKKEIEAPNQKWNYNNVIEI